MADLHEAFFRWPHTEPNDVILTGSFDQWSRSVHLTKGPNGFEGSVKVPWGQHVPYKFIVDESWKLLEGEPTELDEDGNLNNIYTAPEGPSSAAEPPAVVPAGVKQPTTIASGEEEPASEMRPTDEATEGAEIANAGRGISDAVASAPESASVPTIITPATASTSKFVEHLPEAPDSVEGVVKDVDINQGRAKPAVSAQSIVDVEADKENGSEKVSAPAAQEPVVQSVTTQQVPESQPESSTHAAVVPPESTAAPALDDIGPMAVETETASHPATEAKSVSHPPAEEATAFAPISGVAVQDTSRGESQRIELAPETSAVSDQTPVKEPESVPEALTEEPLKEVSAEAGPATPEPTAEAGPEEKSAKTPQMQEEPVPAPLEVGSSEPAPAPETAAPSEPAILPPEPTKPAKKTDEEGREAVHEPEASQPPAAPETVEAEARPTAKVSAEPTSTEVPVDDRASPEAEPAPAPEEQPVTSIPTEPTPEPAAAPEPVRAAPAPETAEKPVENGTLEAMPANGTAEVTKAEGVQPAVAEKPAEKAPQVAAASEETTPKADTTPTRKKRTSFFARVKHLLRHDKK